MLLKTLVPTLSLAGAAFAASADDWRSRSIYQVIVDRFALEDGSNGACNPNDAVFCGGSWNGLKNKLDYIQGMGFSAIWISPVGRALDNTTAYGQGYHGYWPTSYTDLNSHFGNEDDLKSLSQAVHDRGMYLMVDVVVNHFASWGDSNVPFSSFSPLNAENMFHSKCYITDWSNQEMAEQCWMGDSNVPLPDVNTENDQVVGLLKDYVSNLVTKYSIDGLRLDAAKSIRKDFWPDFCGAAGVYCTGEAWFNGVEQLCPYQDYMDSVHNYVMQPYAVNAFKSASSDAISSLANVMNSLASSCKDATLLTSFMENHDNARMGAVTSDMARLKTFAAITVFSGGVPTVYYGQEQAFKGASDPNNREPLWTSGYATGSDKLYDYFNTLNTLRNFLVKDSSFASAQAQYTALSGSVLQIEKSGLRVLLANTGSGQDSSVTVGGWSANESLVDALGCTHVTADGSGNAHVTVKGGLPVALYPESKLSGLGLCSM
ncbi:glycoside hydrolase family 13 protein [Schizophyllum amplum]|uniref:Alpha-amylase n=1 Tax=Schizophyllum amplum TaxID=97359 RepID=A0A550CX36_9AGAR|nr:glycoside hydrolase family 13 protein [Auriculariopsis ampla]